MEQVRGSKRGGGTIAGWSRIGLSRRRNRPVVGRWIGARVCSGSSGDSASSRAVTPAGAACTARTPGRAGQRLQPGPGRPATTRASTPRQPGTASAAASAAATAPGPSGQPAGVGRRGLLGPLPGVVQGGLGRDARFQRLEPQRGLHPRQRHPEHHADQRRRLPPRPPLPAAVRSAANCTRASVGAAPGGGSVGGQPGQVARRPAPRVRAEPDRAGGRRRVGRRRAGPGVPGGEQRDDGAGQPAPRARPRPVTAGLRSRAPAQSRSSRSARSRSAGYGLVNSTQRPSAGWAKPSERACSHCRVSPSRWASVGSAP